MRKYPLAFLLFVTLSSTLFAQKLWNQKADFPGTARNNGIGFSINGKGYIGLGQSAGGTRLYDFYEYDPASNKWTQKANFPSSGAGFVGSTGFVLNGKGYVCFGVNGTGSITKELWEFNPTSNNWTQRATFPSTARYASASFVLNDTAYIIGGNPGGTPYLADVWIFVPTSNTWVQKANFSGSKKCGGTGFTIEGIGYYATGLTSSTSATKDVWKYNKIKDTWSQIADFPNGSVTGSIGFEINGIGYLGTGNNLSNYTKEIYEYDATGNNWKKLDSIPTSQSGRGSSAAFVINGNAYFGTGYSTSTVSLNDFWSYTPKVKCNAKFITQPKNVLTNLNDSANFVAISLDNSATYKWQVNKGTGFTNISNGGQYSGATSYRLSVSKVQFSDNNGHKFRCIATTSMCSDTSGTVALSVNCLKLFKDQPKDVTSDNGSFVRFMVSSAFVNTIMQWQKNEGSGYINIDNKGQYSGSDKDTLTVSEILLSNNNTQYRCVASYGGCKDSSMKAKLFVYCRPIIKEQPVEKFFYKGSVAKFNIAGHDKGTSARWQIKNGSFQDLSDAGQYQGTSSDTLTINSLSIANNSQVYRCVLSYKSCADTTKVVVLNVLCTPIVDTDPISASKKEGESASFTVTTSDIKALFSWQVNSGTGFMDLSNIGQFSNVKTNTLIISNTVLANNNYKFRCILESEGCYDTSGVATLKVECKRVIIGQSSNKTTFINGNTFFYVNSSDQNVSYIWQSNIGFGFQNLSNAGQFMGVNRDTLYVKNINLANDNQLFRVILKYGSCSDTSASMTLYAKCNPMIINQPVNNWGYFGDNIFLRVVASNAMANYKWQSDIGFGFQNLSNAGQFSGTTNDTLFVSNLSSSNENQNFRCLITDGSCSDTTKVVRLNVKSSNILNLQRPSLFNFYPNPVDNVLNIELSNTKGALILIYQPNGQLLHQSYTTGSQYSMDMSRFENGVYYLKCIADHLVEVKKVIKE